ncbi:hypothetical protein [Bradyrhizobium sp. Gha]|uniref:hypothetical protein n=1 Tax=Bradyrhizobium sp. Gha TaxID=1855318 RepID=UPI0008EF215F|nr:hypothetical protein [Bradyrhizobium sp. Gha]SFI32589.1 hypothetical protein SAMN05216525_107121 [Bradyrhizobium sp. Gha]
MALTVICVTGPTNTGKTSTIRELTAKPLGYKKAKGEVRGVFQMPRRGYAVGVNSGGDNVRGVMRGLEFLDGYDGLRVIIVASHTGESDTFQAVERFAKSKRAAFHTIETEKLDTARECNAAIRANVRKIKRLMPKRGR